MSKVLENVMNRTQLEPPSTFCKKHLFFHQKFPLLPLLEKKINSMYHCLFRYHETTTHLDMFSRAGGSERKYGVFKQNSISITSFQIILIIHYCQMFIYPCIYGTTFRATVQNEWTSEQNCKLQRHEY